MPDTETKLKIVLLKQDKEILLAQHELAKSALQKISETSAEGHRLGGAGPAFGKLWECGHIARNALKRLI